MFINFLTNAQTFPCLILYISQTYRLTKVVCMNLIKLKENPNKNSTFAGGAVNLGGVPARLTVRQAGNPQPSDP